MQVVVGPKRSYVRPKSPTDAQRGHLTHKEAGQRPQRSPDTQRGCSQRSSNAYRYDRRPTLWLQACLQRTVTFVVATPGGRSLRDSSSKHRGLDERGRVEVDQCWPTSSWLATMVGCSPGSCYQGFQNPSSNRLNLGGKDPRPVLCESIQFRVDLVY